MQHMCNNSLSRNRFCQVRRPFCNNCLEMLHHNMMQCVVISISLCSLRMLLHSLFLEFCVLLIVFIIILLYCKYINNSYFLHCSVAHFVMLCYDCPLIHKLPWLGKPHNGTY